MKMVNSESDSVGSNHVLSEHLSQAVEWSDAILNEIGSGIAIVDQTGRLIRANQNGLAHLPASASIGRELTVTQFDDRKKWLTALALAVAGQRSMIQVTLKTRPTKLTMTRCVIGPGVVWIVILFERRALIDQVSLQYLSAEYELTEAEGQVLSGLVSGFVPKQIASRRNVAVSTVRGQIKQILMKTAENNIGNLVIKIALYPSRDA